MKILALLTDVTARANPKMESLTKQATAQNCSQKLGYRSTLTESFNNHKRRNWGGKVQRVQTELVNFDKNLLVGHFYIEGVKLGSANLACIPPSQIISEFFFILSKCFRSGCNRHLCYFDLDPFYVNQKSHAKANIFLHVQS